MRGYFGVGVEGLSKPMNGGGLFRTAHAFGAGFIFTVGAPVRRTDVERADTSKTFANLPYYEWSGMADLRLPRGCDLIGIELTDNAEELPSFRHPRNCAYLLGRERGSLSPAALQACRAVVRIPTRFCLNLAVAGAVVLYDRMLSLKRYPDRPVGSQARAEAAPPHTAGGSRPSRRGRPQP